MLKINNITRRYGGFLAIDSVSFMVDTGEVIGLLGQNGAGKSTILKIISGCLQPDSGSVSLDDIELLEDKDHFQRQIGYLPENLPLYQDLTVGQYLDFACSLKGVLGNCKKIELKRILKAVDISSKVNSVIATLSRGYKQRVALAQAIIGSPRLLLLDEPTNGLDPEQTLLIRELINDLSKVSTILLSTHIMQEVDASCSRVLMVNKGNLVFDKDILSIKETNTVLVESNISESEMALLVDGNEITGISLNKSKKLTDFSINTYSIKIGKNIDISSKIASFILGKGCYLYSLKPFRASLESLFNKLISTDIHKEYDLD